MLQNSAVSNLKRLSLELGGKSPNIVFPDADFDAAVRAALWGIYGNKGEMCTAGSRLLLHEEIHDRFVEELAARARKLRLGNPLDPATQMGPQISGAADGPHPATTSNPARAKARAWSAAASAIPKATRPTAISSSPPSSPT